MPRTGWPTIAVIALAVPLMAGCLSLGSSPTTPRADETPAWKKPLSYYAECRPTEAQHGFGQDVPCNGTATRARWSGSPPPGWVCYGGDADSAWYKNGTSLQEQWGFGYDVRDPLGEDGNNQGDELGGVILIETQDERRLYHWPVRDALHGFVAFPPASLGETVHAEVFVYAPEVTVNRSQPTGDLLASGTLSQGWSLMPDNETDPSTPRDPFYLVQNLDTSEGSYHFPVGPDATGYASFWNGTDFDLEMHLYPHVSFSGGEILSEPRAPYPGGC